ncbi:MAG: AAA family ATPase [Leptospirillia bacterium]
MWEGRLDRPLALLSYLAANPGQVPRDDITALFWPDKEFRAARANLSTTLYNIEHRLESPGLFVKTPQSVGFSPSDLPWESDPVDLWRYLREDPPAGCSRLHPPADCPRCRERIECQREMGRRLFLEGCAFSSMGGFGEWVLGFRSRLSRRQETLERQFSTVFPFSSPSLSARPLWEIRQITFLSVLFTGGGSFSDPEEVIAFRESFRERVNPVVRGLGGEVQTGLGGIFHGIFGFLRSLEDASRRAVMAAREIRALAHADPFFCQGEIRLALHTGEGLSDLSAGDPDPVGDRIREVDRIVRQAPAGEILATWETARLVDRFFRVQRWGSLSIGSDGPERVLFLVGEALSPSGFPEMSLVGRRAERSRMEKLLAEVRGGGGLRALWVTGEAGIGKSALLGECLRLFSKTPGEGAIRQIFCLSGDRETPYSSVIRFLRSHVGIDEGSSLKESRYRVERYLLSTGQTTGDNIPLLLHLLCGEGPWSEELGFLSPELLRSRLDALILSILSWRSLQPFLLTIEDLQWMDPTTADLLKKTIMALRGSPVLLLLTARDEEVLRKMGLPPPDDVIRLSALSRAESREMIESLMPGGLSPATLKAGIDRGGGVPLYLRELVLSGALSGAGGNIPTTLKELLGSRIGALGESRTMAKVAACLGQSVDWPLLSRATERYASLPSGGKVADAWLDELVAHRILEVGRSVSEPEYRFRHALLREWILASLPGSARREIHRILAEVLREEFPSRVSRQPEILGEHLTKAGLSSEAVDFIVSAGDRAAGIGAYEIALDHYGKAVALLESEPSSPESDAKVLRILLGMVRLANVVWGFASPEAERLGEKARDLVRRNPGTPLERRLSHIFVGIGLGLYGPSWTLEKIASLPPSEEDAGFRIWGSCLRGTALFWKGELARAFSELSVLRTELLPNQWKADPALENLTESPPVLIHGYLGYVCLLRGQIAQSRFFLEEGYRLDDVLRLRRARVFLGVFDAVARCMAHDVPAARTLAQETLVLAEESGLHMWEQILRLVLLRCDPSPELFSKSRELVLSICEMLPGVSPIFLSLQAEMALMGGLWDEAIETSRMGREEGLRTGTRVFDPLFYLIEALALRGSGDVRSATKVRGILEKARKAAEETGSFWHALRVEVEMGAMGRGNPERLAALLGKISGGESLPLVVAARQQLERGVPKGQKGRRRS